MVSRIGTGHPRWRLGNAQVARRRPVHRVNIWIGNTAGRHPVAIKRLHLLQPPLLFRSSGDLQTPLLGVANVAESRFHCRGFHNSFYIPHFDHDFPHQKFNFGQSVSVVLQLVQRGGHVISDCFGFRLQWNSSLWIVRKREDIACRGCAKVLLQQESAR